MPPKDRTSLCGLVYYEIYGPVVVEVVKVQVTGEAEYPVYPIIVVRSPVTAQPQIQAVPW
jgi:hypothetical protein